MIGTKSVLIEAACFWGNDVMADERDGTVVWVETIGNMPRDPRKP